MAKSGSKRDSQFATGFLSELTANQNVQVATMMHCRAKASLGKPLGAIDGDVAVIYQTSGRWKLLIVEREGSAPGNERNILKWYHALNAGIDISTNTSNDQADSKQNRPNRTEIDLLEEPQFQSVDLLLAFTRTEGWSESDFNKTAAFCGILAELVNSQCRQDGLELSVRVEKFPSVVGDSEWEGCGRYFARFVQ